jgi:hypothetical protein
MPRYAVLHDIDDRATRPVALLVESDTRIRLFRIDGSRGAATFDGNYMTIEPDGSLVTYRPGEPEYWDYVLLILSRTYLVGEVRQVQELGKLDVLELFYEKVVAAREPKPKPYLTVDLTSTVFIGFNRAQTFVASAASRARAEESHGDEQRRREEQRQHSERHRSGGVPVAA